MMKDRPVQGVRFQQKHKEKGASKSLPFKKHNVESIELKWWIIMDLFQPDRNEPKIVRYIYSYSYTYIYISFDLPVNGHATMAASPHSE